MLTCPGPSTTIKDNVKKADWRMLFNPGGGSSFDGLVPTVVTDSILLRTMQRSTVKRVVCWFAVRLYKYNMDD